MTSGRLDSWSRAARDWIFCASVRLRQNAYTSQKLGLNFCLTLTLRLMGGGNHALHYESTCLGLPVGTLARVCLGNSVPEGQLGFSRSGVTWWSSHPLPRTCNLYSACHFCLAQRSLGWAPTATRCYASSNRRRRKQARLRPCLALRRADPRRAGHNIEN